MPFRFIHTADVHLDSPLRTLALKNEALGELVANATRTTFVRIIDLCVEEQVDALVIAGDLYDGELTSMKTAVFFVSEMQRLVDAGIKAFVLRGNHDAESKITKHIDLPDGVHVFSSRGTPVTLDEEGVVLHGVSFAKPHVPESLLTKYRPPAPDMINIGVLHTSLAGSTQHDPYSPCSLEELQAQGYTYWALGHIHKREVHGTSPATIVMPGIPQGRHINEAGPRSVTLVTIDDERRVHLEERVLCSVQFERVTVDLSGCVDWQEFGEQLDAAFVAAHAKLLASHLVVRLQLVGNTALSGRLRRDKDELDYDVQARASAAGSIWIEQTDVSVQPPVDASTPVDLSGPVAELRTIVGQSLNDASPVVDETLALMTELRRSLPVELREAFDAESDNARQDILDWARTGAAEVLARLEATDASVNEGV